MELAHNILKKKTRLPSSIAFYTKLEVSWIEKHGHIYITPLYFLI